MPLLLRRHFGRVTCLSLIYLDLWFYLPVTHLALTVMAHIRWMGFQDNINIEPLPYRKMKVQCLS